MYTIMMDGQILYSPIMIGKFYKVLNPKLSLDVDTSGSFSFVIPPSNHMHGAIKRRKSIVTVHRYNRMIFMGRVLDSETDAYNQIDVYCEGVRSYLNDSQAAPYTYTGTPRGLLAKLISEHNAQIEPEKQFILGDVTIDQADEALECENVAYWQTFKEIEEKLLSAYGGYLSARIRGGSIYLDWLKDCGRTTSQKIRFAVNLLDLKDKSESGEMFTILRPLGASQMGEDAQYKPPVNIASVNGGLDYIQDDEAVANFGKIWHTQTWPYIEDPAELLAKGREYLKIGAEVRTLTLKAIDMHFLDGSIDDIRIGDKVHIVSQPHGIDMEKTCCKIEIDLVNPEETIYTFGGPPKALTDNIVKRDTELEALTGYGGGGRKTKEELKDYIRWAEILADPKQGSIALLAGEVKKNGEWIGKADINLWGPGGVITLMGSTEELTGIGRRLAKAEIDINGTEGSIGLKASVEKITEDIDKDIKKRLSSAELILDGEEGKVGLIAQVKDHNDRLSSAELILDGEEGKAGLISKTEDAYNTLFVDKDGLLSTISKDGLTSTINQTEKDVTINASKINLSGYVTAGQLSTEIATINKLFSGDTTAAKMVVTNLNVMSMTFDNMICKWSNVEVPTSVRIPALSGYNVRLGDGSTAMLYAFNGTNRTCSISTDSMSLMKATT